MFPILTPTPRPPPPPNPSCHQLPTSQGNYEVHPGNKDNPQVRAKCKTIYCDLTTYLLFLDFLWGHPNPCEVQQFRILRIAHKFQSEFISKFLKSWRWIFNLEDSLQKNHDLQRRWISLTQNGSIKEAAIVRYNAIW